MIWNSNTGVLIGEPLKEHSNGITCVCFSPDGELIVTGSKDKIAIIWNAKIFALGELLIGHSDGINSVTFSPDGRRILTGSRDKTAIIWDAKTGI